MSDPVKLKRINHVEFVVGNAKQAAYFYRRAFGFDLVAYRGPETGCRDRSSYVLRQGKIRLILTTPLLAEDPYNMFLALHGDGVKDICFEVEDVDTVFEAVHSRGANVVHLPENDEDSNGQVRRAAIRTYGDTIHTFIDKRRYDGPFLPGFEARDLPGYGAGLHRVDHIVGNVEDRQMDRWVAWYNRILDFDRFVSYDDKDISTEYSALRSTVVTNHNKVIKFPINEPADGKIRSQIQEYIDFNTKAGVQHLALAAKDICESVALLRENGVEFLDVPKNYYERVWDRVGEIKQDRKQIEELGILVDADEKGYLLQLFTKPLEDRPTFFIEIIQRCGSDSFGKGNFKALFETIEQDQMKRGNL